MKKSDIGVPERRGGVLLKPGEQPGRVLQMRPGLARTKMSWGEIALVSVLDGFLVLSLAIAVLWIYRWTWNPRALVSLSRGQQSLYGAIAIGVGFVSTAALLVTTGLKKSRSGIVSLPEKKRPSSSKLEDKWRRRS